MSFCAAAALNARDSGAFRDPGDITTSVMPASIIWRTIVRAKDVDALIYSTLSPSS